MAEYCCLYVLLHDYVNVRVCNLLNPHHTGGIENRKQHTADLQLVALFPSHLVLDQFDLSLKVHTTIQPVFVSQKIEQELNVKETKPPIVNQQCVIYGFQLYYLQLLFFSLSSAL